MLCAFGQSAGGGEASNAIVSGVRLQPLWCCPLGGHLRAPRVTTPRGLERFNIVVPPDPHTRLASEGDDDSSQPTGQPTWLRPHPCGDATALRGGSPPGLDLRAGQDGCCGLGFVVTVRGLNIVWPPSAHVSALVVTHPSDASIGCLGPARDHCARPLSGKKCAVYCVCVCVSRPTCPCPLFPSLEV